MGQFKPMVKMMTSEPSVELKLKKGGAVKKADGGVMGLPSSMPSTMPGAPARGGLAPSMAPRKPSMAARRKAMMASPAPVSAMKKGGKAEGGETKAEHKAEMKKIGKVEKELKSHEAKPASKAHKGYATGGVVMGQGGFKKGGLASSGIIKSEKGSTKMDTAQRKDNVPAKTGAVKLNKAAGYKDGGAVKYVDGNVVGTPPGKSNTKTGAVKLANAGGYCKGGSAKKYARGGAVVQDDGKAEKMPQGHKKPPTPVSITALSGTYKKGGQVKKMKAGGDPGDVEDLSQGAYDRALTDTPTGYGFASKVHSAIDRFFGKQDDTAKTAPKGALTKTKESVTVTPAKKRGGSVKC